MHATDDWRRSIDYEVVANTPEVRAKIEAAARQAKTSMSGEQMLAGIEEHVLPQLFSEVTSLPEGSMEKPDLAERGREAVKRAEAGGGMKTGKVLEADFSTPPGALLAAALISFARRGMPVLGAQQAEDGCAIEASLPTGISTWAGARMLAVFELRDGSVH